MHNPETVQENETRKILWDFKIQMDNPIPTRRADLVQINNKKENLLSSGFYCSRGPKNVMKESEKLDKWLNFANELE